ncbi:hypothetical protein EBZ35_02165 [bacterium]|nr:hypothetical protein [bacterium]
MSHLFRIRIWMNAIRIRQWPKNSLVFVPLIAGHYVTDITRLHMAAMLFMAFCLVASGTYLLNDIMDRHDDRHHPGKQHRPIASGQLSIANAAVASGICIGLGFVMGGLISINTLGILGIYTLTTIAYTLAIKKMVLWDVGCLSGLYTLRLIAGHVGLAIPYSGWLLGCCGFFFCGLALLKRCVDIITSTQADSRRGYVKDDITPLTHFGIVSGYLSVMVLALYITHESVQRLYANPSWLWLLCPMLWWWISRLWWRLHRQTLREDPLRFALKDPPTYGLVLLIGLVVWVAT